MGDPLRIRLPHAETDERKRYSMTDPDSARLRGAMRRCRYGKPTREDLLAVLGAATDYLHLTTYELGQEHCVSQLRDVWRARRARRREARSDG